MFGIFALELRIAFFLTPCIVLFTSQILSTFQKSPSCEQNIVKKVSDQRMQLRRRFDNSVLKSGIVIRNYCTKIDKNRLNIFKGYGFVGGNITDMPSC